MSKKFERVNGATKHPIAPPVYRPQPTPKVLQAKRLFGQNPQAAQAPPRAITPPPVYRPETKPEAKGILQPQRNVPTAPAVYRPQAKQVAVQAKPVAVQAKMARPLLVRTQPTAPPVYRPQPAPRVLQTKKSMTPPVGPPRVTSVVQRDVDVSGAVRSENHQYMVLPGRTSVLYSIVKAEAPKPRGLYTRRLERMANYPHLPLYEWTPNVRFLSKAEQMASPSKSNPGSYEYTSKGFIETTERFSLKRYGRAIEEHPEDDERVVRPLVGALGKNDCYAWADTLQNMMFTEASEKSGIVPIGREHKTVHVTTPKHPSDLNVEAGDMMKHIYQNAKCKYHAATVVAKDGNSLVTLEGHVSKDITSPEFHIHRGVLAFADEAIRKGHGDEVVITPLESLNPQSVASERKDFETRYQRMTTAPVDDPGATNLAHITASSNIGTTITDKMRRKMLTHRRIKAQLNDLYERDREIHFENVARKFLGGPTIPVEYSSFPNIDDL